MGRGIYQAWMGIAALAVGAGLWAPQPCPAASPEAFPSSAQIHYTADQANEGFFDSLGNKIKHGFTSLGDALTIKPKVEPAQDPTSLQTPAQAGPNLHVAMGRLHEEHGNLNEAAEQYQQAIKMAPTDAKPVVGLAHVKSRQGDLVAASKLYQQAAKLAPNEPAIYNDMALCLAQRWMHSEAVAAMEQAIRLQPNNLLYRNNLAAILVDAGRCDDAFGQLRALRPEPVAHYNLGYLLYKKGQTDEALRHFVIAANQDPSLTPARQMVDRLQAARALNVPSGPRMMPVQPAYAQQTIVGQPGGPASQGVLRLPPIDGPDWSTARQTAQQAPWPPSTGGDGAPTLAEERNAAPRGGDFPPVLGSYNLPRTARVPRDVFEPLPPIQR